MAFKNIKRYFLSRTVKAFLFRAANHLCSFVEGIMGNICAKLFEYAIGHMVM